MPELISGIFNYCDRWCEKCDYTDRCRLFQKEAERNIQHILNDEDPNDPKVFVKDIAESLSEALTMLKEQMEDADISENDIEEFDEINFEESLSDQNDDTVNNLIRHADEVFISVDKYFKDYSNSDSNKSTSLSTEKKLNEESIQILFWYSPQIAVKTRMCVGGKRKLERFKSSESREFEEEILNVNSRIAFTGIKKCCEALYHLSELDPDSVALYSLLSLTNKLKDDFAEEFPQVFTYKRPYFD